jgi:uncharacterized damage-inducible protein DinB
MIEIIKTFYSYNSWATNQLMQSLNQLSAEQYDASRCSAHGSIRDTLAHLLSTQWGWISWFDGSMSVAEAVTYKIKNEEIEHPADAKNRWVSIDSKTNGFVESLTEEILNADKPFTLPNGFESAMPLWKMMLHVANHGTHTRAQIVAAIRRAGVTPANCEMIYYLMTNK